MDDFGLAEPELVDAEDVLQAFEEQGLASVKDVIDLTNLPAAKHLSRLPSEVRDGPSHPADQPPGATIHPSPVVAESALPDLPEGPNVCPPSPTESSLSMLPYYNHNKRQRNLQEDLMLLRAVAATPLTPRGAIDWSSIHEHVQGNEPAYRDLSLEYLRRSFLNLIQRVDSGDPAWRLSEDVATRKECWLLITRLKQTCAVGLGNERVPVHNHAAVPRVMLEGVQQKLHRKMTHPRPRVEGPEPWRPVKVVSVRALIRDVAVDEELTRRSQNVEDYVSGRVRFIPNLGSWRSKYIDSDQLAAMRVLTDTEGDVEAAAQRLGTSAAKLERHLDEWIIERRSARERRDASPSMPREV